MNPNTQTAPVFRTQFDADLISKIYSLIPVMVKEGNRQVDNAWDFQISRFFDINKRETLALCSPDHQPGMSRSTKPR